MTSEQLDNLFGALADSTRRAILTRLMDGDATVKELAKPFEMSLPAVTRHIQVLEKAGLVTKSVDKKFRPCRLNGDRLKDLAEWAQHQREAWERNLDQLEKYLAEFQKKSKSKKEKKDGRKR
jgi:DNA-binding transcriptional ArsR family regulator